MEKISIQQLMKLYLDTMDKCGVYLLNESDQVIAHHIFEEFDTGVISFLHINSLQALYDAGWITNEVVCKSSALRTLVMELQQGKEWNIYAVRHSPSWRKVLELADEIKKDNTWDTFI
ncbi:hypothetical protein [Paenibacillus bovis]|uniref:Uncharacterized protein n=1 Tax=Paenibacillus bovis TaxID=1616788 RepID=A0A172ZL98_9BACL|nr:hypothetical protein [Paenibacillus bovis]ANF98313.1 hypothetical protein AR543_21490 [Paenibacillus bovis]